MATEPEREEVKKTTKSNDKDRGADDDAVVISIDLPAPDGWVKKFTPKTGGTPRKNEIVFISPTGVEIKNKRQLDLYLKSHPGGPHASEFDWGTGDTPRRSARISGKSKATVTPESERPKKIQKKSSSKKGKKAKEDDTVGEGETKEDKDVATEETKETAEVETKDAEDGDRDKAEVTSDEALTDKADTVKDPVSESEIKVDEKPENLGTSTEAKTGSKEEDEGVDVDKTEASVEVEMKDAEEALTGKTETEKDPVLESEIKIDEKLENPEPSNEVPSGVKKEENHISAEKTKESGEVEKNDADDVGDHDEGKVTSEEALTSREDTVKDTFHDSEIKTDEKPENSKASKEETSGTKEEDKDVSAEETKESAEVEMKDVGDHEKAEVASEEAVTVNTDTLKEPENPEVSNETISGAKEENKDNSAEETKESAEVEMKDTEGDDGKVEVTEALTGKGETVNDPSESKFDEKPENPRISNEAASDKNGDNKEEAEKEQSVPEASSQVPVPDETENSKQEEKNVADAAEVKKASEAEGEEKRLDKELQEKKTSEVSC